MDRIDRRPGTALGVAAGAAIFMNGCATAQGANQGKEIARSTEGIP
jgi:hypothetical protein